jgi:hypothetical protein
MPGGRRVVALGDSSTFGWGFEANVALPLEPDLVTWSYLSNDGALTGRTARITR